MPFLKLASYFFLLASFSSAASKVHIPAYFDMDCKMNKIFTSNGTFHFNLNTLLSSLSSKAAGGNTSEYYRTSVGSSKTNDVVYGMFMCRGDVPHQVCRVCVQDARHRIASQCPYSREAIIWYEECLIRYSDRSFFYILDEQPKVQSLLELQSFEWGDPNTSHQRSELAVLSPIRAPTGDADFRRVLNKTLNDAVVEAAKSGPQGAKKFATKEAKLTSSVTLYTLVQCTPDLSAQLCVKCLHGAMYLIPWCCVNDVYDGTILTANCYLKFGDNQFYYKGKQPPSNDLLSIPQEDDPSLLDCICSNRENFTAIEAYQNNFRSLTLILSKSSNITKNNGFYNATVVKNHSNTIYGLFMCRGDVSPGLCRNCVDAAIGVLDSSCHSSKEAIIWYDVCMLRYSNRSFFSTLSTGPKYINSGVDMMTKDQQKGYNQLLENTLNEQVMETVKSGPAGAKKFVIREVDSVSELQTLYTLSQCTPDLSGQDCETCLRGAQHDMISCCIGKIGGTVMYPSCNLRFQLYRFYYNTNVVFQPPVYPPTASRTTDENEGQSQKLIIAVVLPVVSIMLVCLGYYSWLRIKSKRFKAILEENFGSEGATLECLQFNLATIEVATNKFSVANRIGKGGFGEVYKGILPDGREIAIKRLSESSQQGLLEFKNEVLLIAKLQHRNLVALFGFCLKDQEKILVYEYVPNKSLDYFLFDSQRTRVLNWSERYKVIGGIARGILYLHEHSRLKIIHRDLKPSNILLDDEMNPKISDFGMARMVNINEVRGSTNRIVGTLGYMSPEYVTFGLFSEKSDIFSFGVIVLEIISGKKNASPHNESQYADGLLGYVWKHWRDEELIEVLDSNLTEADSQREIIKCIHIGLLCVQGNPEARPSMGTVVQYLNNDLIELPSPQEPAFFMHDQMEPETSKAFLMHGQCSVNEMSETELSPR